MITYGTNPGMGMKVTDRIPTVDELKEMSEQTSFKKSLEYMGLEPGSSLLGKAIDYVFIGSCTNARIEDLRLVASMVKGKTKAKNVEVWVDDVLGRQALDFAARGFNFDFPR